MQTQDILHSATFCSHPHWPGSARRFLICSFWPSAQNGRSLYDPWTPTAERKPWPMHGNSGATYSRPGPGPGDRKQTVFLIVVCCAILFSLALETFTGIRGYISWTCQARTRAPSAKTRCQDSFLAPLTNSAWLAGACWFVLWMLAVRMMVMQACGFQLELNRLLPACGGGLQQAISEPLTKESRARLSVHPDGTLEGGVGR